MERTASPALITKSMMRDHIKALTGLDRESAHTLQLHAMKQSFCTGGLSP